MSVELLWSNNRHTPQSLSNGRTQPAIIAGMQKLTGKKCRCLSIDNREGLHLDGAVLSICFVPANDPWLVSRGRSKTSLIDMIMRHPGGDDGFFSDVGVLNTPPSTAVDEVTAPSADWRFLPQQVGRRQVRMDVSHRETTMKPRLPKNRVSAALMQMESYDTLYFG